MNDDQHRGSFDELVAGISSDERKYLLAKINQNREHSFPLVQPAREETDGIYSIVLSFIGRTRPT